MKKRLIYSCLLSAALLAGCTKKFDEINTNPTAVNSSLVDPNALLSQAEIQFANTGGGYNQLMYQSMWSQSLSNANSDYFMNGDKYVISGSYAGYISGPWNTSYGASTLVDEMKNLISGKTAYSNLDNVGTIFRMMILERVTDEYGDCPFSQEGQAKTGIYTPVFDTQQSIYASMLTQLEAACTALNTSGTKPSADLLYGGDITKWKKLGYSLMLRAAMRLTKVDPTTAQKYAEMAYAGGTMASISDNAKVYADNTDGYSNSDANVLLVKENFAYVKWSNTLISYMKSTKDPRVSNVGEIQTATGAAGALVFAAGDTTYSKQIGEPNGYDFNGGATDISKATNYPGAYGDDPVGYYSRPRYAMYSDLNRANFLLTYGETELLLAEAATRGWNTGAASTHYANALTADMQSLSQFNATSQSSLTDAQIAAYVAANPLSSTNALQQINMEYFVETSTLFNFNETWTNWRRSGYPVLTPVTYTNQFSISTIPRRIIYPTTLPATNPTNYASAVARLSGGDVWTARMYWDSK